LGTAQLPLVRGLSLFVGGASRKQIVHLLDAHIANFSMDASPAVTACFAGNDMEMLQDQRAIWELSFAPPLLKASQQQAVWAITVENGLSHHLTYIENVRRGRARLPNSCPEVRIRETCGDLQPGPLPVSGFR
jgi:hypothetical protein